MSFELRGSYTGRKKFVLLAVCWALFFLNWWIFTDVLHLMRPSIMPSPVRVVTALPEMFFENHLSRNVFYSVMLNAWSYVEAILIAIPIGFAVGLIPPVRAVLHGVLDAMRFLPLTAVIGLFILWFGIETQMKVQFLTLGILVYLLPTVVQRIDDVLQVHLDTIKTLGANNWQTITKVYWPVVISWLSNDIRVLVPISWTYIIIAEIININDGGVGALIYTASRQSRVDKVFAILGVIVFIAIIQDFLFRKLDRWLFPHKYANGGR